jgi:hypothetical protein
MKIKSSTVVGFLAILIFVVCISIAFCVPPDYAGPENLIWFVFVLSGMGLWVIACAMKADGE